MKRDNWIVFIPFYLLVIIIFIGIAKGGSDAVTTINQAVPLERQFRFVIDAGHGGIDGGATSCTGVLESKLNLDIALCLNDLLNFLGYETIMIRTTDVSIYTQGNTIASQKVSDLKERVRIANETENALLISIHQNTFPDSRYSGAQVFYADTEGSRILAQQLQHVFCSTINRGSNRKIKSSTGIYLMQHIDCPGILVECGFLSNSEEEAMLRDTLYQKKLSAVIAACVSTFSLDCQSNG